MPTTTKGLPYPSDFASPTVPSDLGALALAVDVLLTPTGTIVASALSVAPTGWLLCNGALVSRTTYATLFNAIGSNFGAGDGSTTFGFPNLLGRVPVGRDATQTEFDTLSETGGAKTHIHSNTGIESGSNGGHNHNVNPPITTSSSDSHSHTAPSHAHGTQIGTGTTSSNGSHTHGNQLVVSQVSGGTSTYVMNDVSAGSHTHTFNPTNTDTLSGGGSATTTDAHSHTTDIAAFNTVGGEGAHTHSIGASDTQSNLMPYQVVNYIIKT